MHYLKGLFCFIFTFSSFTLFAQDPCQDGSDSEVPSVLCQGQVTVPMSNFDVEIWAIDLDVGSVDNCTEYDDLVFAFDSLGLVTSRLIDCVDVIDSPSEILMYVIDTNGNYASCPVELTVIPGPTVDCYAMPRQLSGYVTTYDGAPIEDAEVIIDALRPEFPILTHTDENGYYEFQNILTFGDYTIEVRKERSPLQGVSTLDLVMIQRHMLGLQELESPYLHFAADISGDSRINALDLLLLRKLILGIISDLPTGSDWLFFDAAHQFFDPENPLSDPPSSLLEIRHLGDGTSYDFIGVEVGNVR